MNRIPFVAAAALLLLMMSASSFANDIATRAESAEMRLTSGKVVARVVRDKEHKVIRLRLNNLQLSSADIAELAAMERLRSLVLLGTNVSDDDLVRLEQCKHLEHLNLTSTEITDAAIKSILKMHKLKSLCLGNVNVTDDGIEKLRVGNQLRDKANMPILRWGYSKRKRAIEK